MNPAALITRLESFADELPVVVARISDADACVRPPSGAWSILEIVCHLGDEEVEDFRARLRLTLEDPTKEWPAIDPEGVAIARRYNEKNLAVEVQRFVNERLASIMWLRSLKDPNWESAYVHPKWGAISAGMLMTAWAAHDMLHLRQIAKRRYELACRDGAPFDAGYAGAWGP
jgi:DinB superfamily